MKLVLHRSVLSNALLSTKLNIVHSQNINPQLDLVEKNKTKKTEVISRQLNKTRITRNEMSKNDRNNWRRLTNREAGTTVEAAFCYHFGTERH